MGTVPVAEKSSDVWIDTRARGLKKPSDHTFLVSSLDI
jgi:hypothetical protein